MSSEPFPARFRTVCAECCEWIATGETIVMTEDGAIHRNCADEAPRIEAKVCDVCWLTHPAGECDR